MARTGQEVKNLFITKFSSINSGVAPDINPYEISIYLTEAKKQIIDFYSHNNVMNGIDQNERIKKHLSKISLSLEITSFSDFNDFTFKQNYQKFVELSKDVWRVLYETVKFDAEGCQGLLMGEVQPMAWDELISVLANPFRGTTNKRVIRTDVNGGHLLLSKHPIESYNIVYLKFPTPYIIMDLEEFSQEYGYEDNQGNPLSIDGETSETLNELDLFMDDLIINRAIELAIKDYKEGSLGNTTALNNRIL